MGMGPERIRSVPGGPLRRFLDLHRKHFEWTHGLFYQSIYVSLSAALRNAGSISNRPKKNPAKG